MRVVDLSQDFSMHTPAFASYEGPSIKWTAADTSPG
jgi:arylformamidase